MGRALSHDLRERVLNSSKTGLSARKCAERFGVAASTAIRWIERAAKGETTPRTPPRRVSRLWSHADFIDGMIDDRKDITLDEMVVRLAGERGVTIGRSMLSTWLRSRALRSSKAVASHIKKVRPCTGAGTPWPSEATSGMVRCPTRS